MQVRLALAFNAVGILVAAWAFLKANPPALAAAALAPLVAVGLVILSDGAWVLHEFRLKGRPAVGPLFLVPAIALGARAFTDQFVMDWKPVLAAALVPAVLVLAPVVWFIRREADRLTLSAIIGVVMLGWAWSVVTEADVGLDKGPSRYFTPRVMQKWINSSGRGGQRFHVLLAPWGPKPGTQDVQVGSSTYDRLEVGSPAFVTLHRGAFGWRWFVIRAGASPAPAP